MNENLKQTINYYCTNELNSFRASSYFHEMNNLSNQINYLVKSSFDFAEDGKKDIYLYFSINDLSGNTVIANEDDFEHMSYATIIVKFDKKGKIQFLSWQDEDFIETIEWTINKLKERLNN